ncbi:MAG TPA: hypothetical protein VII11_00640, partial [Bacteroidota bacterium]
ITGRDFVVLVQLTNSTIDLTRQKSSFGTGPTVANKSRITIAGTGDTPTQWSRSGQADNKALEELNAWMQLRSLSTACRIYRGTVRGDIDIVNSLEIHGVPYVPNGATWDVLNNEWQGEWQEVQDNAPTVEYETVKNEQAAAYVGGDKAAIFTAMLENVRNLTNIGALTQTTATLSANVAVTSIAVQALPVALKAGAKPVIVSRANAKPFQVTLSSAAAQGATTLNINSFTPDEPLLSGSFVYPANADILSSITINENAINLRVQAAAVTLGKTNAVNNSATITLQSPYLKYRLYAGDEVTFQDAAGDTVKRTVNADAAAGATEFTITAVVTLDAGNDVIITNFHPKRFMSELNIQWDSITASTGIFKSDNFNGTIDGSYNITDPGTTGWALTGAGDLAVSNAYVRGTLKSGNANTYTSLEDDSLVFVYNGTQTAAFSPFDSTTLSLSVAENFLIVVGDWMLFAAPSDGSLIRLWGDGANSVIELEAQIIHLKDSSVAIGRYLKCIGSDGQIEWVDSSFLDAPADAAGFLSNNGAGVLSWVNGATFNASLALDGGGSLDVEVVAGQIVVATPS